MTLPYADIDQTVYHVVVYDRPDPRGEDTEPMVNGLIALNSEQFDALEKRLTVFGYEDLHGGFDIVPWDPEVPPPYSQEGILNFIVGLYEDEGTAFARRLWEAAGSFTREQVEAGEYPGFGPGEDSPA